MVASGKTKVASQKQKDITDEVLRLNKMPRNYRACYVDVMLLLRRFCVPNLLHIDYPQEEHHTIE